MTSIEIAPGATYEPKASMHSVPAGYLCYAGDTYYVQPFAAPTTIKGEECPGAAKAIGKELYINLRKATWLSMLAADRKAAGVDQDVAAAYAANEAARKRQAALNREALEKRLELSAEQVLERDYDQLQNEGAYGYNPHRVGDRPTYWPAEECRERHHPEGA